MSDYRVVAVWGAHPDGWRSDPIEERHATLDAAEQSGGKWGCLAGIIRVEVYGPDGRIQALWDKESKAVIRTSFGVDPDTGEEIVDTTHVRNQWQRLGDEARAAHTAETAIINAAMREGLSTVEAARRLRQARADGRL